MHLSEPLSQNERRQRDAAHLEPQEVERGLREFEASLVYSSSSKTVRAIQMSVSSNNNKIKHNKLVVVAHTYNLSSYKMNTEGLDSILSYVVSLGLA